MSAAGNKLIPDLSKLDELDGFNYRRWSQRIMIFFEQLDLDHVLLDPVLVFPVTTTSMTLDDATPEDGGEPDAAVAAVATITAAEKYAKDNKTVRGHLLSHMSNKLFDMFHKERSAKVIWDTLEKNYGADDVGIKKYVVGEWLKFQMTDEKPIMDQVHDYEKLVSDILAKDYRNSLKHKKRDISLEELVAHMKIEEANRLKDKVTHSIFQLYFRANLVDTSGASGSKFRKTTKKGGQNQVRKPKPQKTANFKKPGKLKPDGRTVKCYFYGVVSEVNLVENNVEWVVDTGASKHFCATREYFTEFERVNKDEKVYMGNSSSFEVMGKGKVLLKLTSGKTLALNNVLKTELLELIHTDLADFRNNETNQILNRVPHKKLDHTPYELWKVYAPNLLYLKVWGCLAKVGLPDLKKFTIGSKTVDAVFIVYASNSASYRFIFLHDYSVCESRDVVFFETIFPLKKPRLDSETQIEKLPSTYSSVSARSSQEIEFEPRRNEEIYMEQPLGFEAPGMEGKVCRLKKSFYGLKQAPKQCPNIESINKTKSFLSIKFDMTDLGEVDVILGVKVTKTEKDFL
ncbi:hypothetical protein V6N11_025774 [Hibiscus sabdariffa]|uniref:Ty1-copia retrotransposon protein n=1 Tax=Hibiscus sabdariffa TaxID=183260 RepID=A0ABR2STM0_9ROSI